jgi:capsular polysaccharide transport system permease protein
MTTIIKRNKWEIWRDVIFALFTREISTGFNDKFGISWAVIEPIAFIFILSYGRSFIGGEQTHSMPTFVFMAYGMLFIQTFLQTLQACTTSIKKNKSLFAFRQVKPISSVLAAAMFELLVKIFVIIGILFAMYITGIEIRIDNPLMLIVYTISLWWMATMLGMLFAVAVMFVPEVQKVQGLFMRPLFFLSGVFFSMKDIPREYWHYLNWNPILHAIELSRYAAYTSYGQEGVSSMFFFSVVLTVTFISLAIYYSYWRQALSK